MSMSELRRFPHDFPDKQAGETGDRRNIIPIILSGRGKLSARFGVANQKELAPIATLRHVVRHAGDDDPSESSHGATP